MSLHKYIVGVILACTVTGIFFSVNQCSSQNQYATIQMLARYFRAPNTWIIPFPVGVDTSVSARDSLDITEYAQISAGMDTAHFIRSIGNGTASIDTVGLAGIVNSASPVDSFIVYVRADTSSTNVGVTIKLTGRDGSVPFNQTIYPTVVNAWQRKVFVTATTVTPQEYIAVFRPRASLAHRIDVTPLFCKKR